MKILRVLEEHRLERVGGGKPVDVDVRLVAATNRDLEKMVAEGTFREDLYFRLNVVAIQLPPLRDRPGDIPLLAARFLAELANENGVRQPALAPETLDALAAYPWPGNVRELRNTVERMIVLAHGDILTPRDLPPAIRSAIARPRGGGTALPEGLTLGDAERRLIVAALEATGGNRVQAAKRLGISRRTLHRKINELKLHEVGKEG